MLVLIGHVFVCAQLNSQSNQNKHTIFEKKNSAAIDSETDVADEYRSYGQRWFILCSILLLNISNYAHWIAFASVQSKAAEFYLLDHQGRKG